LEVVNFEIADRQIQDKGDMMFGHQYTDQNDNQAMPAEPPMDVALAPDAGAQPVDNATVVAPHVDMPSAPAVTDNATGNYIMTEPHQATAPNAAVPDHTEATVPANTATDDLLTLKQQALQQLSPLVGHLDQTPEEKFRTTMMLIQASDNQTLLKDAYAAAQAITDQKTRAQALLDVVNEINYFTQQHQDAV
jgi:hypothetical protein